MNRTLAIINGIALVSTIIVNYLSNTGVFNGNTMQTVSDQYLNLFTPAGYAFSIWGLIYLGLLAFSIYTGRFLFTRNEPNQAIGKIGWWFLISSLANSLWVVAWLYNNTLISVFLMVILLLSLINMIIKLKCNLTTINKKDYMLIALPFNLYLGWISVAIIANIAAYLTKISWSAWGVSAVNWTLIMLVVAGLVNMYMVTQRNMRVFGLVGIWALLAIATRQQEYSAIVYTSYGVATAILLGIFFNLVRPANKHLNKLNLLEP
ncbi:hypothetical protein ACFRAE_08880 [Sphingobacterium sp. HJSM2_6]|uniref:hypothetical protein n=1 Tax=Sphingobacterium sp. HJSM2_6 TaxID=3366264 RepID=UPI003BDED046